MQERWHGRRTKADEAAEISGIQNIKLVTEFDAHLKRLAGSGRYQNLCLDLFKFTSDLPDDDAYNMAKLARDTFPWLKIASIRPMMKSLRLLKNPCEIEALRRAETINREGILAMMCASRPGMYEYQHKAKWDYALAQSGTVSGFPPIISAGNNNFCIHYYAYTGKAADGDFILNNAGATWDGMITDISRAWPCSGVFSEKQKLLYTCAFNISNYIFSLIKPGMPINEVDEMIRRYNYE